ncbi:epimerase/dehydrogenase [Ectocarpus siliculosus]|uniref:Epimerase/dehydrogenase n=1 Tax=Ectocarpus siliculosus TaxID=2880 RepID=D7FJ06_ECTSI|nr:epimerase/dehydrogenase [Ectocarpus siliculosus]|eukprot:CBJ49045.1 epimerase/dehydrogenase [Ectocarpus siliculosus]
MVSVHSLCLSLVYLGTVTSFVTPCAWNKVTGTARSTISGQSTGLRMAYGKVFVAGGAKGVGRAVIDKLVDQGSEVVALVRREDAKDELEAIKGVSAVVCDALDLKGVEAVLDGCDAAITTLGGAPEGDESKRVDYAGNRNVIESAGILGITRVVMVTSVGCGSSREAISDQVYQVLEKALKAKTLAENMLLKYYTNSEWTIIRPGGLKSDAATGTAILTEDTKAAGVINRADVADLAVQALNSPSTVRKILTAVDPAVQSSYDSAEKPAAFAL